MSLRDGEAKGLAVLKARPKHGVIRVATVLQEEPRPAVKIDRSISENAFIAGVLDNGKLIAKIQFPIESPGSQTQAAVQKAAADFQADVLNARLPGGAQIVELRRRDAARPILRIP